MLTQSNASLNTPLDPYLSEGCGRHPSRHGRTGCLHIQVLVVDERPCSLHRTGLEVIVEGAHVRVPEHTAVKVLWGFSLTLQVASFIITGVSGHRHLRFRPRASSGARFGAVVLHKKVLDALDGRVVGQVPPAGPGRSAGALGVGAQGATVASVTPLSANSATKVQGGSYKLRVTLQYFTLCPYCS